MSQTELLMRNKYMSLATVCEDRSPYNVPITYAVYDGAIYWRSSEAVVHSKNIARDNRVSITIYDHERPSEDQEREAAYIQSAASIITGDEKSSVLSAIGDVFSIKDTSSPLYKATVGDIDTRKSTDTRFYTYRNGESA